MEEHKKLPKNQKKYVNGLLKAQYKTYMQYRREVRLEKISKKISEEKKKQINTMVGEFMKTFASLSGEEKKKAMAKFKETIKSYSKIE